MATEKTAEYLDKRIALYIQENHKEILELLNGVRFWERFWPHDVFPQSAQSHKDPIVFKASFNASIDPITENSGDRSILELNNGYFEDVFKKIENKEPVSHKDVAIIHVVMSAFENGLNQKVKFFNYSKEQWEPLFDEYVKEEMEKLQEYSIGTSLTAMKILTLCYPEKMGTLVPVFDKVFANKIKQDWKKKIGEEPANDTLAIIKDIVDDYKLKLKTFKEVDVDQISEQYLKSLNDMLLKLNEESNHPHVKATQQVFTVLLNDDELLKTVAEIASRSSIYDGQIPTIFADNRKPPVIGAVIAAVKAVYTKYEDSLNDDVISQYALMSGFKNLAEDGKAVVIRSVVEDFSNLDYKKVTAFYKKMGGNPYYVIPAYFDRGEKTHTKTSPFAQVHKKDVRLADWIYDRISTKKNEIEVDLKKDSDKKPFKMVK